MGNSESSTTVNSLSEVITNVAMSTVQDCVVVSEQAQSDTYVNNGFTLWSGTTLEQQTEVRSQCFSDVKRQAELQNKIIQEISQATSATGMALLPAFGDTKSSATTNLTSLVENNITMSNIQKSYNGIKQGQTVDHVNNQVWLVRNVNLKQGAEVFAAATLQEVQKAGILTDIEKYVDQTSSAKVENPLDAFAAMISAAFGSFYMGMILVVVLVLVCGGVMVWAIKSLLSGGDGRGPSHAGAGGTLPG